MESNASSNEKEEEDVIPRSVSRMNFRAFIIIVGPVSILNGLPQKLRALAQLDLFMACLVPF